MDPLATLQAKISDFPGYGTEDARRRSGQLARAYLGEALAELRQRLEPLTEPLETKIDDAIDRTAFSNQAVWHAFEDATRTAGDFNALILVDAALVDIADRAASVDAANLEAYLEDVQRAFDSRDVTMRGYAKNSPATT